MPQKRPLLTPEETEAYIKELQRQLAAARETYEKWGKKPDRDRINALETEIENLTTVAQHMRQHRGH